MGVPQASEDKVTLPRPVVERRRIRKPIMEKKRRDRINSCLDELSSLLAEERLAEGEEGKATKLEKADILEQTVRFWQGVRNTSEQGEEIETLVAEPDESSYLTGYKQCIRVVDDLLSTCQESGTETLRQGLLQHLSSCVQELTPPPSASDATESDIQGPKTVTTPDPPGVEQEDKPPPASPQCLTLVPARLPDGALALLLQEGSEGKHAMKDEGQQHTPSSSEPDSSSTSSSASTVPQRNHERSQQLIKVKATQELLSAVPSTRAPHQATNPADTQVSPPSRTTANRENKREASGHDGGGNTGAVKAPDALGVSVDYILTETREEEIEEVEMKEKEETEKEEEEEGETPMDLCIDRVWRPW